MKLYSISAVMKRTTKNIKSDVNETIEPLIKKIIKKVVKKSARKEAFEILLETDTKMIGEFLFHYHSDSHKLCKLQLDKAKDALVRNKKRKQYKNDYFGTKAKV